MLHNEETTLLQQEVHSERNEQRSTVSNDGTLVSNRAWVTLSYLR